MPRRPAVTPDPIRSRVVERSPHFFGWNVTAAAALVMGATIVGQTAGVALFIDAFIGDLSLSRQTVSLAYSGATIAAALVLPLTGRALDRWEPRRGALAAAMLLAVSCVAMGQVRGLVTLIGGFFLLRALGQGALALSAIHVVNLWFVRRRGLAIGLMGVGMALAVAVVPIAMQQGIDALGWRATYAVIGACVLVVVLPIAGLFFRHRPERYGLLPDGPIRPDELPTVELSSTLVEARRTSHFWTLVGSICVLNCLGTAYLFHHVDLMTSGGVTREAAAVMFVAYGLVNWIANLGAGLGVDRWGPRKVLAMGLALFTLLTVGLPLAQTSAAVVVYGVVFGVVQGIQSNVGGSAFAYYFGRDHIGAIKGFTHTLFVAATAIGPPLLPLIAGLLGGYSAALWVLALAPLGATVAVWAALPHIVPSAR